MDDLSLQSLVVKDQSIPQRDGTVLKVKRYRFYLGNHGPFQEDIPLTLDQAAELRTRVTALRTNLQTVSAI